MQLTNVLRDVSEDTNRDRIYLPLGELEENNIKENELDGTVLRNKNWEPYVYEYSKRARTYLEEGKCLLPLLPRRARYSPAAMIAFYEKISIGHIGGLGQSLIWSIEFFARSFFRSKKKVT